MPYTTGDIVRIEDVQSLLGQTVRNAYFYEITDTTGAPTGLEILDAFETEVINAVLGIQVDALTHTGLKIDNVTDGLSFAEVALTGVAGASTAPPEPSYTAYGFKLLRGSKLTRNGYKRIAGVPTNQVDDNSIDSVFAASVPMQTFISALEDTIALTAPGGTATLRPVIASRPNATRSTYLTQPVTGVELQMLLTTQVSRKAGRGE